MPREPQFSRLPLIWRKLDKQGLLERFLGVEDTELNRTRQKIQDILSSRDVSQIPDKFLKIIGYVVGHRWKSYQTHQWNRQRISELINLYSYKSTSLSIKDLAYEYNAPFCDVVDMASTVAVWNIQGTVEEDNCYFFDADFYHPGVFLLFLSDTVNLSLFLEDFEYIKLAGTKWYIYLQPNLLSNVVKVSSLAALELSIDLTPKDRLAIYNNSTFLGALQKSLLIESGVTFASTNVFFDSELTFFDPSATAYI